MKFSRADADLYVPDGAPMPDALARTTHLCIGAHQDDQEFMAYHGIAACFGRDDRWFTGVVVTNGGGSARTGLYAGYSDADMMAVRRREQRKAAMLGEYACQIQLGFPSAEAKSPSETGLVSDLTAILMTAQPEIVYLHNPADKHDTHVAVVLRSLAALRALPEAVRPRRVYGCEIWRSLDWLCDADKTVLRVDAHANLAAALSGVFDSQIAGGKRYDAAVMGRRMANATFFESHEADTAEALSWAMDLTALVHDPTLNIVEHTMAFVERFRTDVVTRLQSFMGHASNTKGRSEEQAKEKE
jgi:LmbE family N-acetylglucosaminyl deacetylase